MMTTPLEVRKVLDEHPAFAATLNRFVTLYDASDILTELKPPWYEAAAEYLREIARHLMRDAGMPDSFIDVMITSRPAMDAATKNGKEG